MLVTILQRRWLASQLSSAVAKSWTRATQTTLGTRQMHTMILISLLPKTASLPPQILERSQSATPPRTHRF